MVVKLDQSHDCRRPDKRSALRPGRILITGLFVLVVLRLFVLLPVRVVSESMLPTLHIGDILLADTTCYGLRLPFFHTRILDTGLPHRGDVVLFAYPLDKRRLYLKRVIGLPGDVVLLKGHSLFLNGKQVIMKPTCIQNTASKGHNGHLAREGEEVIADKVHGVLFEGDGPTGKETMRFEVPAGKYFVLGDNRDHSIDSRTWGFVPAENLVGRPFIILFSWDSVRHHIDWSRTGMHIH
ncbi:MAG TPA: signal peptidase I [Desulfobulbus sp.]|nr:signal peptidase I [Desulfobulbus sp.]